MNSDDENILNNEILPLLQTIEDARTRLEGLGVVRSKKDVIADYAEWLAAREYGLTLAPTGVNRTFDATDKEGRTYQIKSRRVESINNSTSFDFRNYNTFDYLIVVLIDTRTLKPLVKPIKIAFSVVSRCWRPNATTRRFRWNKTNRSIIESEASQAETIANEDTESTEATQGGG